MKVVHVINALGLGGGAEHALAIQLPMLRERGVTSHVVCLQAREGGLQKVVGDAGFPVEILSSSGVVSRARELRRVIATIGPDLVHGTLFDACLTSRLALLGRPTPLVNSIVNLTYDPVRTAQLGRSPWKARAAQAIDALTVRRVDCLHALTEAVVGDSARALHLSQSRFTIIPRGRSEVASSTADEWRTKVRREFGVADEMPVLVTVGRQDDQKDQLTLVDAFEAVGQIRPDAELWLVGRPGGQTAAIDRLVAEGGAVGTVRRLGHRDDAIELIAAADLFVLPSRYEGLGSVLLEAMSVGTPVVVSDTPALVEVADGAAAAVVPAGDSAALGDALIHLMRNPARRAAAGAAGLSRFQERFTLGAVTDATVEMYRGLSRSIT